MPKNTEISGHINLSFDDIFSKSLSCKHLPLWHCKMTLKPQDLWPFIKQYGPQPTLVNKTEIISIFDLSHHKTLRKGNTCKAIYPILLSIRLQRFLWVKKCKWLMSLTECAWNLMTNYNDSAIVIKWPTIAKQGVWSVLCICSLFYWTLDKMAKLLQLTYLGLLIFVCITVVFVCRTVSNAMLYNCTVLWYISR